MKFHGVISLRKDLPICPIPNGIFLREVLCTFLKFTKIPCAEHDIAIEGSVDAWSQEKMMDFIKEHEVPCPSCGKHNFTDIRQFNLMFKTFQGVTEDAKRDFLT